MKSMCMSCAVTAIIGATIGLTLAYFFSGSVNVTSLASGALLGGLIGLYIGVSAAVPLGGSPRNKRSGLGSTGGGG